MIVRTHKSEDDMAIQSDTSLTCEFVRDERSQYGGYWFMRCSNCGQQSNEHLIMAPYWNFCMACGAKITGKEGEGEWKLRKLRGEV